MFITLFLHYVHDQYVIEVSRIILFHEVFSRRVANYTKMLYFKPFRLIIYTFFIVLTRAIFSYVVHASVVSFNRAALYLDWLCIVLVITRWNMTPPLKDIGIR